jgi:predicted DNA-binding WGR domain protein
VRRWEFAGDGSSKFWEADTDDATVTVRYGRVGSEGRTQLKQLDSAEAARRSLEKAIAEKERKGYKEVTAEARSVVEESSPVADGRPEFPDEETFAMPASWRRMVYPRRGGIRRTVGELRDDAEDLVAARLKEEEAWVEDMLSAPASDRRIVEATRAHLNGSHSPLGAAALAAITMHYQLPDNVFVDTWVRSHGLAFAARAVVEEISDAHGQLMARPA